jgi:hypothetical protein
MSLGRQAACALPKTLLLISCSPMSAHVLHGAAM